MCLRKPRCPVQRLRNEAFFKKILADTCPFLWPLVPLFWISGDVSSGFQSHSGLPYSHCGGKCNVRSWDPPLVLHLPTSWQLAHSRSCPHILLQRWGCRDSNSCSQNICEPDALPTELNRDRLENEAFYFTRHSTHVPEFNTNFSIHWV